MYSSLESWGHRGRGFKEAVFCNYRSPRNPTDADDESSHFEVLDHVTAGSRICKLILYRCVGKIYNTDGSFQLRVWFLCIKVELSFFCRKIAIHLPGTGPTANRLSPFNDCCLLRRTLLHISVSLLSPLIHHITIK